MHDTKERLSLFWLFALLNYLYADCTALFAIVAAGIGRFAAGLRCSRRGIEHHP